MTYTIVMSPPALPGEVTYTCETATKLRVVVRALNKLKVEIIDVECDGESLTIQEFKELVGE